MTLTLRKPTPLDLPPLYNLAEDRKSDFLDDYHDFSLEYAKRLLEDEDTIIIDDNGFAAGAVWFTEKREDLHAQMHLLIRPEYWRRCFKEDIFNKIVDFSFENVKVSKLLAQVMDTQKTALKILRKYGFFEHKPWHKHTKHKGVKVDIINFELKKGYWEKKRGLRRREKSGKGSKKSL
jgi:RimJ/RimL family protein N-acetyltransferase